jgi:hypothetical protein
MTNHLYLSTTQEPEKSYLSIGDFHFKQVEPDEDAKKKIDQQLDNWELHVYCKWYYKNLCYNHIDEEDSTKIIPVKDIVNMNRGIFSSNDVVGAYLVENSEFTGIIIKFDSYSGFGMSSSTNKNYCIFKTNGETIGESSNRSGHCSTEIDEWSYTAYSLKCKE